MSSLDVEPRSVFLVLSADDVVHLGNLKDECGECLALLSVWRLLVTLRLHHGARLLLTACFLHPVLLIAHHRPCHSGHDSCKCFVVCAVKRPIVNLQAQGTHLEEVEGGPSDTPVGLSKVSDESMSSLCD
jgi:hypothetical protein